MIHPHPLKLSLYLSLLVIVAAGSAAAGAPKSMLAEEVRTTQSAQALALKHGVRMSIAEAGYKVHFLNASAKAALEKLMLRAKPELT